MDMNATLTNKPPRPVLASGAALLALLCAAPAHAQDEPEDDGDDRGWIVTLGGGVQAYPHFPGDDDLRIYPMPILGFRREGTPLPLEAPDEGRGFGILGRDSPVNFGPAIQFQNKRDEEDVGAPVGNVGFTVEAGAFVEAFLGENFRLRAEGRRGIGGHEAWVGDLGADLFIHDGERYVLSIGPRLRLGDNDYMDAYFGVTPIVSAAAGLPAFNPSGGVYAVGGAGGLTYELGGGVGLHAYVRYDRLVGDAADSPIVTRFGSVDQFGAGLGLSYSFTVGRSRR